MSEVNCYLVGGPMDGKTIVTDHFRQDLRFSKAMSGDIEDHRSGLDREFEMYYVAAVPPEYRTPKQAVYIHQSCDLEQALLSVAASRSAERDLLHGALGMLRRDGPMTEKKDALIRKIEEHLK